MPGVVIVDDSDSLRQQITQFFKSEMEFRILAEGCDGEEAVALYRKHRPDLMTLDINMPNKDGMCALEEILKEFPDAKIMMISSAQGGAMRKCLSIGAKSFVEKPLLLGDETFVTDFKVTIDEILSGVSCS